MRRLIRRTFFLLSAVKCKRGVACLVTMAMPLACCNSKFLGFLAVGFHFLPSLLFKRQLGKIRLSECCCCCQGNDGRDFGHAFFLYTEGEVLVEKTRCIADNSGGSGDRRYSTDSCFLECSFFLLLGELTLLLLALCLTLPSGLMMMMAIGVIVGDDLPLLPEKAIWTKNYYYLR